MPLDVKQVFEVLGITEDPEKIEKQEDFKTLFESQFTSKKNPDETVVKQILGKHYAIATQSLKKTMKKYGSEFGLTEEDLKSKGLNEIIEYGIDEVGTKLQQAIELEKKNAPKGNDEKLTALESEVNKYKLRLQEENEQKNNVLKEYESFKIQSANDAKNVEKRFYVNEVQKKIKFSTGVNPLTQKGFHSEFNEKYDWDFDPEGNIMPVDKKTGKFIQNPKISGKNLSGEELYELEGVKAGIWEMNPHTPKPGAPAPPRIPSNQPPANPVQPNGAASRTNVIAPRAV